jgi:hypothetical protein
MRTPGNSTAQIANGRRDEQSERAVCTLTSLMLSLTEAK